MNIPLSLPVHWMASLLLIAMASFALLEAKSASLIPKSLFLWPACGVLFAVAALAAPWADGGHASEKTVFLAVGLTMAACSLQALLVNIRKLSRWPSGLVWLALVLAGLLHQIPYAGAEEPAFHTFLGRLSGILWAAIGITKVVGERTVSQEIGIPPWILLLYLQAVLIASAPN